MPEALVEEFAANAETAGFLVHRGRPPEIEGAGVSRAAYGLADTGSVVLVASPEEPRARHLLPDIHVSLLPTSRILPGLAELFAEVGGDLPSALTIVTGPSRSADIEQRLVVGVHGPREVLSSSFRRERPPEPVEPGQEAARPPARHAHGHR